MLEANVAIKIDEFIETKRDDLIQFASKLVRAKSVNPPGDEREVAEVVSQEMVSLNLTPKILDHGDNYRSVVTTIGESKGKLALMLNGHIDTVPPGEVTWDRDPFSGDVEDGILYGRGASDMKAGDAAMTYATAALKATGLDLKGELRLALTSSEETVSIGAKAVANSDMVKGVGAVLIAEPSNLAIYTSEKGCFWLRITAKGKTAHGSMPQCGVNAIDGLSAFLDRLREHWVDMAKNPHPELGPTTASVNTISGGVGTNVVPDMAQANVDIRTIPGQNHSEIISEMQTWIETIQSERPGLSISIEILNDRAPYEIAQDHATIEIMADSIKEVTGQDAEKKPVAFYTDASIFGPLCNLPVVIFGPGYSSLAHQPNELVKTEDIVTAAKAIAHWAATRLL